ncbi:MAG: hypothetical protein KC646_14080 [Candidatus Cloacimonetes bacterium]|nr:hypothetical protein [Candidatus Cloacimonadota bacterium]
MTSFNKAKLYNMRIFFFLYLLSFSTLISPQLSYTYAEEVDAEGDEEYEDEEEGDEEYEEEGSDEEYEEYEEESFDEYAEFDDEEGESGAEETFRGKVENLLDFLDQHRDMKIIAEQFIYPFGADGHKPMLSKNLIPSVGENIGGFTTTKVNRGGSKKKKKVTRGKFVAIGTKGARPSTTSSKRRSFGGLSSVSSPSSSSKAKKGPPAAPVILPPFVISGKFGIRNNEYIIIGNRFYTVDQKLKGSRALKKVVVTGIDDQLAYFAYKDREFQRKIQATKKIFGQ